MSRSPPPPDCQPIIYRHQTPAWIVDHIELRLPIAVIAIQSARDKSWRSRCQVASLTRRPSKVCKSSQRQAVKFSLPFEFKSSLRPSSLVSSDGGLVRSGRLTRLIAAETGSADPEVTTTRPAATRFLLHTDLQPSRFTLLCVSCILLGADNLFEVSSATSVSFQERLTSPSRPSPSPSHHIDISIAPQHSVCHQRDPVNIFMADRSRFGP